MLLFFSLPEPSIVVPSALDKKKKKNSFEKDQSPARWRGLPPPSEPLSSAAADQTQTKPHSPSEGRGLGCFAPRYGPAETCVAAEHFSIQRSVGENTFFSQAAEPNTKRWLFSVKRLAESDLGDSHQTSSCSWVIRLGDRAAWLLPLIYLAWFYCIYFFFYKWYIWCLMRKSRCTWALPTCPCTINSLYITRSTTR